MPGTTTCRRHKMLQMLRLCLCNHIAKNCTKDTACSKCGDQHNAKDCTNENKNCINCQELKNKTNAEIDTKHTAFDTQCPIYKKWALRSQDKINIA